MRRQFLKRLTAGALTLCMTASSWCSSIGAEGFVGENESGILVEEPAQKLESEILSEPVETPEKETVSAPTEKLEEEPAVSADEKAEAVQVTEENTPNTNQSSKYLEYECNGDITVRDSNVPLMMGGDLVTYLFCKDETDGKEYGEDLLFMGNGKPRGLSEFKDGPTVTPNISFSEDGSYVTVTYLVENTSTKEWTYSLGVRGGGNRVIADDAAIYRTDTGLKMINNNTVSYLVCKDTAGVTDVDSLWLGKSSEQRENIFQDGGSGSTDLINNDNTGVAFSWKNRKLAPGETATYSYQLGVEIDSSGENFTKDPSDLTLDNTDIDAYVLDQVKKYTSDEASAETLADRILASGASEEIKFKRLNAFYKDFGLTDPEEGIHYLSNITPHEDAYHYLTTNGIYCANHFWKWLFSKSGTDTQKILYANKKLLNSQTAPQVTDLSSYSGDKSDMNRNKCFLLNFLHSELMDDMTPFYVYKTVKYLKDVLNLNSISETAAMREQFEKILSCSKRNDLKRFCKTFIKNYVPDEEEGGNIYINGETFAKIKECSQKVLFLENIYLDTIDEIVGATFSMANELDLCEKYRDFLTVIYENTQISLDMRLAAYDLKKEIDEYQNRMNREIKNSITVEENRMSADDSLVEGFLDGDDSLEDFLSDLYSGLTWYFVEEQAAYTQGYAELAAAYSQKLHDAKTAFKNSENLDNAWDFFKVYSILWSLRSQGEKNYQKLCTAKKQIFAEAKTTDYGTKPEMAEDTLQKLEQKRFANSEKNIIPKPVQYVKKIIIQCPVDVKVTTKAGEFVALLRDGQESDVTNSYGRFSVTYQPYSKNYVKTLCLPADSSLQIIMSAVAAGYVDYHIESIEKSYSFDKVDVSKGDRITTDTDLNQTPTYSVYRKGKEKPEKTEELQENKQEEYIPVDSLTLDRDSITLSAGKSQSVKAVVLPKNATNTDLDWMSSNESIVEVRQGVIAAKAAGTAVVYAKAIDSEDIERQISVVVKSGAKKAQSIKVSSRSLKLYGVKDSGKIKVSNVYGKVTYTSSNPKVAKVNAKGKVTAKAKGKAIITIRAAGNASYKPAVKKVNVQVTAGGKQNLLRVKGLKAVPIGGSSLKVTWKKTNATRYRIRYSYNKTMKNSKFLNINKNITSKTIKNLTRGKTVYVKILGYRGKGNTASNDYWSKTVKSKGKIK